MSITCDPKICSGKPIIKETRITVSTIVNFLKVGDSIEELLKEYPSLTKQDIEDCISYSKIHHV
jgi:uncharacterized protein (DUF433 family)